MLNLDLAEFYRLTQFLTGVQHIIGMEITDSTDVIAEETRKILVNRFDEMLKICDLLGLELSSIKIDRLKRATIEPQAKLKSLLEPLRQLEERVNDEIDFNLYLVIPRAKAAYYEQPALFGDEVAKNFFTASYDIQEAGNCFATARNTACVMHLMRALEVALDAIGLGVGVPNTVVEAQNSWERLLAKIADQIKSNDNAGDPTWTPKRQFFVDAHAHLFAVKNAWRNPSMHLEKKYEDREAQRIYNAVKDFMEHLATHLDTSGRFMP
jgi:hypothetical protein